MAEMMKDFTVYFEENPDSLLNVRAPLAWLPTLRTKLQKPWNPPIPSTRILEHHAIRRYHGILPGFTVQ